MRANTGGGRHESSDRFRTSVTAVARRPPWRNSSWIVPFQDSIFFETTFSVIVVVVDVDVVVMAESGDGCVSDGAAVEVVEVEVEETFR